MKIPFTILMYNTPENSLIIDYNYRWGLRVSYHLHYVMYFGYPTKPTKRQIRKAKRMYRKNPTKSVYEDRDFYE
ncbi:hypothetical protein JC221_027 [Yersinia phage JC221]|nr:hypothetical protein JC221_027 [Yersinia phage JC221]